MVFKFNSAKAVQYANTYLNKDNYFFRVFKGLEGEVSFISQCILSGSDNQMCKSNDGWFYENENSFSLSWIDEEKLKIFLLKTQCGPFGRFTNEGNLTIGDIVFLNSEDGQKHVGIVTKNINNEFFACFKNKKYREISLSELKGYDKKYFHILGVKK